MSEHLIYAVIADKQSTELTRFSSSLGLGELGPKGVTHIVQTLAEHNPAWKDVLFNHRVGMIFDAETGDQISFNSSTSETNIDL